MAKLNQIVAVVSGKKTRNEKEFGDLNKVLQKPGLFNGFQKRYEPIDDAGDQLPPESKVAVKAVRDILSDARVLLVDTMDSVATQEFANCTATADVSVGNEVILSGLPVTVLLYLEKQLNDLNTFIGNVPTLDPSESWMKDANTGDFTTAAVKTHRTKKVAKPIVLYPATPEHPAQTQLIQEDIMAGYWSTVKNSTAIPAADKRAMLSRVAQLIEGVKLAREEANNIDAPAKQIAGQVLDFIFG